MAEDLTRWEYKYWTSPASGEKRVTELNKLGDEGWEITAAQDGAKAGIILKRPKQPQRNASPYNPPYNGR